jgi:hypothetical protein
MYESNQQASLTHDAYAICEFVSRIECLLNAECSYDVNEPYCEAKETKCEAEKIHALTQVKWTA